MAGRTGVAPKIRRLADKYPEMSKASIARRVGCHVSNVKYVLSQYLADTSEDELRQFQENRADIVDSVAHRVLSSVTQKKIEKMSAQSAITAFAILHDKSQVLRGQATSINVNVLMDAVQAIRSRDAGDPRLIGNQSASDAPDGR